MEDGRESAKKHVVDETEFLISGYTDQISMEKDHLVLSLRHLLVTIPNPPSVL